MSIARNSVLAVALLVALPPLASSQTLGTFRWQMRSYCNLLTLTVTEVGGVYRVEGTDDECGAGRDRASVGGLAFMNPDGSIGMGLTIVTPSKGTPVHVTVEISLASLSGTWRTPNGDSGPFVFTTGAPTVGSPRPLPADGTIPPAISLLSGGSIVARPDGDSGIPATGPGTRMMWYAGKAAFRAGGVGGTQWDDAEVGTGSTAFGVDTVAKGANSAALGLRNSATAPASIAMGSDTLATGSYSMATGRNTAASSEAATAMGLSTIANGPASTALGFHTLAGNLAATSIGAETKALGIYSVAGGFQTEANGPSAFAFGTNSAANGGASMALGSHAVTTANAHGSFVFADDSSANPFTSFAPHEFVVRAAGGVGFYTNAETSTGAEMAPGGGSWAALSDANMKENFREVSGETVLAKLAAIPIREWNYTSQDPAIRHLGPTAQDFRAAFGLGDFPLRINTTDADGIALAGVQALEARTRGLPDELETLRQEVAALRRELDLFRTAGRER
jgi:hypothetical protein